MTEEQPGKILHEVRLGADLSLALGGDSIYYGSIDSTPLFVMLVGRALVGCMAGIFPLSFSIIRDHLAIRPAASAIAAISAVAAAGGALGQIFGGVITDGLGYRWIFWLSAMGFVVAAVVVHVVLPESSLRTGGRVDILGAFLLACGVGLFFLAFFATFFLVATLWVIESFEPEMRVFEVTVKLGDGTADLRSKIEAVLRRHASDLEVRVSAADEASYLVRTSHEFSTDAATKALSALVPDGQGSIQWNEKSNSK